MIRRAAFWLGLLAIFFLAWFAYNHPDWVVAGPPDDIKLSAVPAQDPQPVVKSTMQETPVSSKPDFTSNNPAPVDSRSSTDPIETLPTGQPQPLDIAADGFDNRCYYMDNGQYTTVIIKDYDKSDHTTFAYEGELDDRGAPVTAEGSVAWCSANDPYRTER